MNLIARHIPHFLFAFLVGVFLATLLHIPHWSIGLVVILFIACAASFAISRSARMFLFAIILFGIFCGAYRFVIWNDQPADPSLEGQVGHSVLLRGVVIDEPDVREGKTQLTVALSRMTMNSSSQKVFGTLLLFVPRYPEYHYGDELSFEGKLAHPQAFTEKDGRVFDYPTYLRSKGIRYQMLFGGVSKVDEGKGNIIVETLLHIKSVFTGAITHALPSPHSALLSGLLLGGKQSLGAAWLLRFRIAGIIHIIVLSGYNMTVVAEWLVVLFQFLGFYGSLTAGGVGIVLFAIMTGGGATVLRAALMAIIVLLAKATGRTYDMGRALLLAGALMVLQNPSILLFDPSFQLSFLASIGLIFVSPVLERRLRFLQHTSFLYEVIVSTLSTQIIVLPLLLFQTGMFSLVALPANLLVLPLIPMTMLLGFIAGVITLIVPAIGFLAALPAHALLSWILMVAEYASRIPYAAISISSVNPPVVFALYMLIGLWLWFEHRTIASHHALPKALEAPLSN